MTSGLVQITGLNDKDIVFVRFEGEGGPHCLPYFISLDHEKESVVVSIRGTLSIEARFMESFHTTSTGSQLPQCWAVVNM